MKESVQFNYNGDAYELIISTRPNMRNAYYIEEVYRFPNNQPTTPELVKIRELDQLTKAAIVRQINRRYPGCRVFAV